MPWRLEVVLVALVALLAAGLCSSTVTVAMVVVVTTLVSIVVIMSDDSGVAACDAHVLVYHKLQTREGLAQHDDRISVRNDCLH
jgi:hypothetical protein